MTCTFCGQNADETITTKAGTFCAVCVDRFERFWRAYWEESRRFRIFIFGVTQEARNVKEFEGGAGHWCPYRVRLEALSQQAREVLKK